MGIKPPEYTYIAGPVHRRFIPKHDWYRINDCGRTNNGEKPFASDVISGCDRATFHIAQSAIPPRVSAVLIEPPKHDVLTVGLPIFVVLVVPGAPLKYDVRDVFVANTAQ
jgi:hypothetical protein